MVNDGDKCHDLVFITGVGNRKLSSEQAESDESTSLLMPARDGTLREYVRQVLRDDFTPQLYSTVPTLGDGMVKVTSDVLRVWINSE